MYLVYEQDIIFLKIGYYRGKIAGLLDGGAGRHSYVDAHLIGDDPGQRGFSEARRAVKKDMVEHLISHLCGFYRDLEIEFEIFLSYVFVQVFRPEIVLHVEIFRSDGRLYDSRFKIEFIIHLKYLTCLKDTGVIFL